MTTNQSLNVNDRTLKGSGPNTDMTNVVDARVNFKARALIATMENEYSYATRIWKRYDVYCEWFDDDAR